MISARWGSANGTFAVIANESRRILKKSVQRGRSERGCEAYPGGTSESLSDARIKLAGFFSILLIQRADGQ